MAVSVQERWKEHNDTGRKHFERAEFAEAEQQYIAALRQATLLGAVTLTELGQVAFSLRDFAQAESYFRRALTIREQALGTESQELVQALNDLAAPYYARGEFEQAERLFKRALAIGEATFGDLHVDLGVTLSNLARLHQRRADWRAAAPLLGRLLAIKQRSMGEMHPHSISLLIAVANARSALGENEVAEELVRRALSLQERAQASDADIARTLNALSKICMASGKTTIGAEIADRAKQRERRVPTQPRVRNTRARLDRDTPDFSAAIAAMAAAAKTRVAPVMDEQLMSQPMMPPVLERAPAPPSTPRAATPIAGGTPARAGTPAKPSTPAAPGLIRAYAQMIDSAEEERRRKARPWWSRLFTR